MKKQGKQWRFAELLFEGEVMATRVEGGLRIKAGDVEVSPSGDGVEVRIKQGPRR
jgi:predicted lipoprotein